MVVPIEVVVNVRDMVIEHEAIKSDVSQQLELPRRTAVHGMERGPLIEPLPSELGMARGPPERRRKSSCLPHFATGALGL